MWSCVYTTGAWAAPRQYRGLCCTRTCLHHKSLSCTWTCLDSRSFCFSRIVHYRGLNCTDRTVSRLKEPVLLLGMSSSQELELHLEVLPVLHMDLSTPLGRELHMNASDEQKPMLLLDMSTPQGPKLHLDLSTCAKMFCADSASA